MPCSPAIGWKGRSCGRLPISHVSGATLERYSHARMAAKRQAMQSLRTAKDAYPKNGVDTKLVTVN